MRPPTPCQNLTYAGDVYREHFSQHLRLLVAFSNEHNVQSRQLGSSVAFSKFQALVVRCAIGGSALRNPIRYVFGIGPIPQMPRIATGRIVAAVENVKRPIPLRMCKSVSNSVRSYKAARNNHSPVTKRVCVPSPRPALIRPKHFHINPKMADFASCELHKRKTARQCKCACGSSPERANWKGEAVLAQPARENTHIEGGRNL